jgi:hypothetical protein
MDRNLPRLIIVAIGVTVSLAGAYLRKRRMKGSDDWPETEATIQSAEMKLTERVGHLRQEVPFFTFSYVVDGEYYSGRLGLRVPDDQGAMLLRKMIDTKITVQYDPKRPSIYKLPDELPVDGFRVDTVSETELVYQY